MSNITHSPSPTLASGDLLPRPPSGLKSSDGADFPIRAMAPRTTSGVEVASRRGGLRNTRITQGGRPEHSIAAAMQRGLGPPEDWKPESIKSRALAGVIALIQAHDMQVKSRG